MESRPLLHHTLPIAMSSSEVVPVLFLHGILGSGRNLQPLAKLLHGQNASICPILIDLPEHGHSLGTPPPYSLEAAAHDVGRLIKHLELSGVSIIAHSFGGKVALQVARMYSELVRKLFILDSTYAATPPMGEAPRVIRLLRSLPGTFGDRNEAMEQMRLNGLPLSVSQWLATNLTRSPMREAVREDSQSNSGKPLRWRFDLDHIELLLDDYFASDFTSLIQSPPADMHIHFIHADRSEAISLDAAKMMQTLAETIPNVHYHIVSSGHWIHVEAPDALVRIIADHWSD